MIVALDAVPDRIGILPDHEVAIVAEDLRDGIDRALLESVRVLRQGAGLETSVNQSSSCPLGKPLVCPPPVDWATCTDHTGGVRIINVYEARGQFSRLLDEAEAGEEIVMARNGKPVVRLVPIQPPERRFGRWQGRVPRLSDAEWAAGDDVVDDLFSESAP